MKSPLQINRVVYGKNYRLFFIWGLALFILGVMAISAATFTTLASVVFVGVVILCGSLVIFMDAFSFWRGKWVGFSLHILIGLLYAAVGLTLISNPVSGSISLTFLLGIFYIILGICRSIYSLTLRTPRWGWALFSGMLSLLLGVLIMSSWPQSSLYIIGLFVGIDLLFSGWAYLTAAVEGRSLVKR